MYVPTYYQHHACMVLEVSKILLSSFNISYRQRFSPIIYQRGDQQHITTQPMNNNNIWNNNLRIE